MKDNKDTFCKVQFNSNILEVPKVCSVLIKSYADDSLSDIRFKLNQICSNMSMVDPEKDTEKLYNQVLELIKVRKELHSFDDKVNGMLSILQDVIEHYTNSEKSEEDNLPIVEGVNASR